ncbi:transglycosylase [Amycolatopsis mediterranei S699]|uniref:Transglycosylase domain-containing protein n=4 Tax=Amycolatopsis mediterranei TaxID=33910 RepID=A0A0H3D725_AMYMU|nr:transglycosylase family protein [Amycolatopsis mediterranei]ADJ46491.1 transglycosylase domain-containing protein [Amycolatopsis mediterranei U32]AFO78202.1 transglycosylase [Amycolatopsis mediterranei S699]AGT85330.1 transglycosylase [Amycolatopsis mediterranei RB]KDO06416.1 transglycosylase [Amycolatopsis mediterranei]KDU89262.1 transglycosylase [Amycolatopsis mediterranei]
MIQNRRRTVARTLLLAIVAMGLPLTAPAAASADPASSTWAKLRMCESSGRYATNTGNGYYGAYQFDLPTWRSVGGQGRPDQATPAEQDYRALYLYRMRGWQPWQCAGMLNLPADADARSKRVPTYTESAYIGGGLPAPPPGPGGPKPAWPGVVYRYGDCADPLKTFQLRMNAFGYGFTGTGCYLEKTRTAVLDLQRANGINDSGLLGPKTWEAAWTGKPPR